MRWWVFATSEVESPLDITQGDLGNCGVSHSRTEGIRKREVLGGFVVGLDDFEELIKGD